MHALRPYQREAVDAVYRHLRERDDNPCVVLPTASGKTHVLATICKDAVGLWGGRVLVLAHVKELLQQAVEKLDRIAPELAPQVGVYSAGLKSREARRPIVVAGIQSVYQRAEELGRFEIAILDEAHVCPPEGDGMIRTLFADLRAINPSLRIIGLTATPFRMTSGPICAPSNILNSICFEVGVRELIVQGYLCPLRAKAGKEKTDTSGLHIRAGEYVPSEVEDLMDQERLVEAACKEILEETRDRKSVLVFTSGVRHGSHVAETLKRLGAEVATLFGGTLDFERDRVLKNFREGALKFLVNVQVLTTGFDAPNTDCVALLRPTMSPGLFAQICGRGFRLHPGKADCLVLDYGGNVLRHGPVDAIRVPDPKKEGAEEAPPAKECPECRALVAPGYATCPECGYEFERREREAKHEATAATAGILTGQVTLERYPVLEVAFHAHQKRGAPEGAPRSMRVEYRIGFNRYQSEWICLEHEGFARYKAVAWWKRRSVAPVPETAEEAVRLAEAGTLAETKAITVRSVAGEEFARIQEYELGDKPFYREPGWDEEEETAAAGQTAGSAVADGEVPF